MYSYRVEFETDVDTGKICVRIPSLNNAADYGDTVEDALDHLRHLCQTVLEYFVDERRKIPPSDAMQNGGALLIKAENRSVDEEFARVHLDAKPGYYTTITVTDTGIGMSQEVLDKIFEPFFTTKEQGKGTGLGLSTVHSIVKNHGGFITVNSSINKGTSFTLFFPSIESPELMVDEQSKKDTPRGNGEHILVVDDEVLVRDIAKQTLELYGYTVTEAIDGTEAVAKYATQRSTIKVVLTDINMPVMDGYATIRALRKINPDVKIIAASGLAADFEILESTVGKIQAFIQKPYPPLSLLELLHEVLSH